MPATERKAPDMKRLATPFIAAAMALASSAAMAQPAHHAHRMHSLSHLGYSSGGPSNDATGIITGSPFPRGDRFEQGDEPGMAAQKPTQPPAGFDDE